MPTAPPTYMMANSQAESIPLTRGYGVGIITVGWSHALPSGDSLTHGGQEPLAEGLQLPVADALHLAKLLECRRPHARHVAQGGIGEDEVRRHASLLRD